MSARKLEANFTRVEMTAGKVERVGKGAIVRDCRLNSNTSLNGTIYPQPVYREAKALYEDAKVYADHFEGDAPSWYSSSPRKTKSICGRIKNVREHPDGGLMGDFHVLPSAMHIVDNIEFDPKWAGFSHSVWCEVADKPTDNGMEVVTKITRVESVDLVAEPATTRGMFESVNPEHRRSDMAVQDDKGSTNSAERLIESYAASIKEKDAEVAKLRESVGKKDAEITALTAAVTDLKAKNAASEKRAQDAEDATNGAKIESALTGLAEPVAKSLRESAKALKPDAALALIESVKATLATGSAAGAPGAPKSESKKGASPEAPKSDAIPEAEFLAALDND